MIRVFLRALNTPILIFLLIIGISIQSSLFVKWPFFYFQPDCLLFIVIWCALNRHFEEGALTTLLISSIGEIHSASPQGIFLISNMAVYLLIRFSSQFLLIPSLLTMVVITFLSAVICDFIRIIILSLLGIMIIRLTPMLTLFLTKALAEAFFSIWIYRYLQKLDLATYKNQASEKTLEENLSLQGKRF